MPSAQCTFYWQLLLITIAIVRVVQRKKNIIHQVLKIMKKKITATIYPFWIIHFCGIENQHLHQSNRLDVWEMNNCHAFTFVVKPVKYTEVAKCLCISVTIYSRSSNIWNKKTTSTNIGKIPWYFRRMSNKLNQNYVQHVQFFVLYFSQNFFFEKEENPWKLVFKTTRPCIWVNVSKSTSIEHLMEWKWMESWALGITVHFIYMYKTV